MTFRHVGRHIVAASLISAFASTAVAAGPELKTDEDKTLYTLGVAMSQQLAKFDWTDSELELIKSGLGDGMRGKPAVQPSDFAPKINDIMKVKQAAAAEKAAKVAEVEKKNSAAFLAKAAGEKGAKKLPSGLIISDITPGTGESPKATDKVKVNYRGTLIDGTEFDSSYKRNQPAEFPLNGVIKCWGEGLQQMKVGGKSKIVCPSDIAYGDTGRPPVIKPGATLAFEVELLAILKDAPTPAAPPVKTQ